MAGLDSWIPLEAGVPMDINVFVDRSTAMVYFGDKSAMTLRMYDLPVGRWGFFVEQGVCRQVQKNQNIWTQILGGGWGRNSLTINRYLIQSTVVAAPGGPLFWFDTAVIAGTTADLGRAYQNILPRTPYAEAFAGNS